MEEGGGNATHVDQDSVWGGGGGCSWFPFERKNNYNGA